jgi:hypothetical protein
MIKDVTAALQACLSAELSETIDALTTLNKHFGRETDRSRSGRFQSPW